MEREQGFRDLKVWQMGMELTREVYLLSQYLPSSERFGLIDQMRRAAVSIPSNIAEGQGRSTPKDFSHFLDMAKGSLAELETQLQICLDLKMLAAESVEPLFKLIHVLRKSIKALQEYLKK